jgi:CheY-like chemotaxis protein
MNIANYRMIAPDARAPMSTSLADLHFLVVDDDSACVRLVAAMLESVGVTRISAAATGSDAYTTLATSSQPVDCILCDIKMPRGNGLQLLQSLRLGQCYQARPDSCFILITGGASEETIRLAGQLDVNGLLSKPFNRDRLVSTIGQARTRAFRLDPPRYAAAAVPA